VVAPYLEVSEGPAPARKLGCQDVPGRL